MTARIGTIAAGKANLRHGRSDASTRPIGRTFCDALQALRAVYARNLPKQLAGLAGCSASHADRAMRSRRTMNADMALRVIASGEAGARVFEAYVKTLGDKEQADAWAAMRRAIRRHELAERLAARRIELDLIETELTDLSSRTIERRAR